ncbi:MAG TPA: tetratricopeptide repeat protein, partial [Rhizomicrobium sp.]|nr:tetratricopeptide repeat protein [Rhizomicrobium sp.]
MQYASPAVRSIFAQGISYHQAGRLDEAIACYRQALVLQPDLASAYNNLANALCEQGKLEEGEAGYRQALALQPRQAELHNNLGTVLFEQEKLDDAVNCYRSALALVPGYAEALNNLGAALHRQGKLEEAETSIRHALTLRPDFAEAHDNLGMVLWQRGKPEDALASTRCALALAPDFTRALFNLGTMLTEQGQLDEAIAAYRQLLQLDPRSSGALSGLAEALAARGDTGPALETICRSIETGETARAKKIFSGIVAPLRWTGGSDQVRRLMVRALLEPWARPAELARSCASLIKQRAKIGECIEKAAEAWPRFLPAPELMGQDISALADDELLLARLVSAQNTDVELERFLTMARRLLLEAAMGEGRDESGLEFHAALARQCFINEYVLFHDDDEIKRAGGLRDALTAALASQAPIPCRQLLAVAAYFPLHAVAGARDLLGRTWPEPVTALLVQQLQEPGEEARLRATILRLTSIENTVSRLVRDHYEENPYPRWVRIPKREKPITATEYVRHKFPFASVGPGSGSGVAEILSAGCGTGQLALEFAQGVVSCVLAVDLSLKSLGYARRKAMELNLKNIEFAQADLLELSAIGRTFDVVESSGVLHHMADPLAGWRALLPLLRPGGFMVLGLYSKAARRGIVEARRRIAQWGYGTSVEDIRRCRQDLLSDRNSDLGIADSDDFFGISSCRDLL